MTKEKNIKKFMERNKMPLPQEKPFMDDLLKQMSLLLVPSAFDTEKEHNIRCVNAFLKLMKRNAVFDTISSVLLPVIIVLLIGMMFLWALPSLCSAVIGTYLEPVCFFVEKYKVIIISAFVSITLTVKIMRTYLP